MQIDFRFPEETVNGSEMPAGDPDKGLCARHVFEISSLSNIAGSLASRTWNLSYPGMLPDVLVGFCRERGSGILGDRFNQ